MPGRSERGYLDARRGPAYEPTSARQPWSAARKLDAMLTRWLTAMVRRDNPAVGLAPARPRLKPEVPRWRSYARREPSGSPPQAHPRDTRPPKVELHLEQLTPEQISGLLGGWAPKKPDSDAFILRRIRPRTRFILIGLAATLLFFCLAYFDHGLTAPAGTPTAIGLIFKPVPKPAQVSLPLLQDPVGIVAIVMTLLTPILFAEQVLAIGVFNSTNEENITYRSDSLEYKKINHDVQIANKRFSFIGRRDVSAVVLLLSAATSLGIDYLFRTWGLFPNWNNTNLSSDTWRNRVYAGWWANPHPHLILAIALWSVGCYFFYFIIKQVYMGAVFAAYIHRVMIQEFGVSPNMAANIDGFWGLSTMRSFMLATYSSALGHTIMIAGILIVWLPFNFFTVAMVAVLTIINSAVVIYPTSVGHLGARREKMHFVNHILSGVQRPTAAKAAQVEAVWTRPLLPFRIRSTLTTVTISLVFPLLLAAVSRLLGG